MTQFTRRMFGKGAGALLCACGLPRQVLAQNALPRPVVTPALSSPAYDRVHLRPSRLDTQLRHQHDLFMGLEDDRLLKPFRVRAGQAAPGTDMGGWYDASDDFHIDPDDWSTANWHGYIPGHSFGQYVSGLSRLYAATKDQATADKVTGLIRAYIPTISPQFFDDYNLPTYTYDKIVVGLIDAYQHVGVTEAKAALDKVTDAALPYFPEKALTREERRARPYSREAEIWDEPYILPEHLFQAWKLGFGDRYRQLALRYLQNDALFMPLAAGISPLKGKHAYSHVNALNSAIEAYYATGDDTYLRAAINGFDFVVRQSYATGGWGPNEELLAADDTDTLLTMLSDTRRTFETPCGAYGHFKLTRSLLKITKDSRYGDSMERVLYNTILGALPTTENGDSFYYSDYSPTAKKGFRGEQWPCCSGTFIQLVADYGISAYLTDAGGVYVNLYVPSDLRTEAGGTGLRLSQTTDYPLTPTSRIRLQPDKPARFSLNLRIPDWAGKATRVTINGQAYDGDMAAGRFLPISRLWQSGDVVEIHFDMPPRLEPLNDAHPEWVAVLTGPLVLFPIDAPDEALDPAVWHAVTRSGPEDWCVQTPSGAVQLKPFMAISDETYRLYSRVTV